MAKKLYLGELKMKRIICVLLSLIFLIGTCGCSSEEAREQAFNFVGKFQDMTGSINYEDAHKLIDDFLDAVVNCDYELAESYLHPERKTSLKDFFDNFRIETSIDFSNGIGDKLYSNVSSVAYDSTVDGATYLAEFMTVSKGNLIEITIEIVENDNGYGISNFTLKPLKQ